MRVSAVCSRYSAATALLDPSHRQHTSLSIRLKLGHCQDPGVRPIHSIASALCWRHSASSTKCSDETRTSTKCSDVERAQYRGQKQRAGPVVDGQPHFTVLTTQAQHHHLSLTSVQRAKVHLIADQLARAYALIQSFSAGESVFQSSHRTRIEV